MILCGRLSSYSHAPKSLCSIVCTILSTFVLTISSLGTERDLHWKEEVAMCFQGIAKSNSDFHIILTNTPFDFNNEVVVRFPSETCEHFLDAHLALLGLNSVENIITATEIFRTPVKIEGSGIKLGVVPELSSTVVRSSILSPMNSFLLIFVLKSKESDEEGPRALNLEFAEVNLDTSSIQVHVINLKKLEAPPANGDASKQYYDIEIEVTETIDGQSNLFDYDVYNLNIAIPGATRSARVQNGVASFKAFPVTPAVNETLKAKVVLQNSFYIEESKPFVLDLLSPTQASLNDQLENLSVQILPGVEPVILGEPFELRVAVMKDNEQHYIPTLTVYLTSCSSCDIVPLRDLAYQIENRYYVLPDSLVTQRNEATQHCKLTFTLLMDNFSKKVDVYLNTQPRIRHELFGAFRNIPSQIISGEALDLTIELLGFKSSMDFTGFGIKLQATRSLDLQAPQCVVYDAQGNTVLRAAVDASGQALFPSTRIVLTSSGGSLQPNSSWPCPMQIDILDPNEEQVGETSNHHLIITMATDLKKDEQQDIVSGNKSDTNKTMVVSSHTTIIIIVFVIVAVIVLTVCATSIAVAYSIYRQRRSSSYTLRLDEVNPREMSNITSPRASRYSANTVNYNIPYSIPPHSTSSNEIPLTRGIVLQTSSQ